jgi:hypothetical protein
MSKPCMCGAEDCTKCFPPGVPPTPETSSDVRPDLPPCPFCGSAAESGGYWQREQWRAFVECSNAECPAAPCCLADSMAGAERGWSVRGYAGITGRKERSG